MTTLAASANALPGTGPSLTGMPRSPALTPTSEASTSAAELLNDRYHRGSWWGRPELASPGPHPVVPDETRNPQAGGSRAGAERILGLKKWEGRILEISDGLLTIELTPSDHDGPELVADFHADLLGPDSGSAEPGDIIYLTTRTVRDATGYPYQTSSLKLRRPGLWGENELREIQDIAKRQAEFFKGT